MATNYPGSLDTFDTIAADKKTSQTVGGRTHRDMHNDVADALEAVQAELGTAPSAGYSTVKARLDALVAYAAKTSAYTATVADRTLNVTSGTFTLDLPAASTCTGQALRVKNSGTGVVTLDGNSSETVEGVATFPLGPGSYVEITSTGSAWVLTGGVPDTGWRSLDATAFGVDTGKLTLTKCLLRRVGNRVSLSFYGTKVGTTGGAWATVPAGSRPHDADGKYVMLIDFTSKTTGGIVNVQIEGPVNIDSAGLTNGRVYVASIDYDTTSTAFWPTSLPGSAA